MHLTTKTLTRAAVIAALYAAITLALAPISFGPMQVRVSEALTLLPCLWPESIAGLFVGCLLSNLIGGYGPIDVIAGSLATLLAAFLTYKLRKKPWLAALPPVAVNMAVIGVMLHFVADAPLVATALYVGLGQIIACYGLGLPMLAVLTKSGLARKL